MPGDAMLDPAPASVCHQASLHSSVHKGCTAFPCEVSLTLHSGALRGVESDGILEYGDKFSYSTCSYNTRIVADYVNNVKTTRSIM
jgi:hypothetical protein